MPPVMGSVAFIMTGFLQVPYKTIILMAVLPAIIYFTALLLTVHFDAKKAGLKGLPVSELPPLGKTLWKGWYYFLPLIMLIVLLMVVQISAPRAAAYSLFFLIIMGFVKCILEDKKLTLRPLKQLKAAIEYSIPALIMLGPLLSILGILMGVISLTGLGLKLSFGLVDLFGNMLIPILVVTAVTSMILGMGLPSIACYILLVILVAPALTKLGIMNYAAHMFIFYFSVAHFITPPVATGAYVAASIARASPMKTAFTAMRMGVAVYVMPFIIVASPALIMQAPFGEILQEFALAMATCIAITMGLAGFSVRPLNIAERVVMLAIALIILTGFLGSGLETWKFIGTGILALWLLWQSRNLLITRFKRNSATSIYTQSG